MFCITDIQDEPHIHLRGFTLDDGEKFFRIDHTPIPYKHFENYFRNVVPAEGTHRTGLTFLIAHEKDAEGQDFEVNESQSKADDWFFPNGDVTGIIYVPLDAINKNLDQRYWYATPSTVYIGNDGGYIAQGHDIL